MAVLEYAADYLESTENIHNAMKLTEIIGDKLRELEALQGSRTNETEAAKAEREKRLKYQLSMELPNLEALASTTRALLADHYNDLDQTANFKMNVESEKY